MTTTPTFDHRHPWAVDYLAQQLIDDLREMADGDDPGAKGAPFGVYAQTRTAYRTDTEARVVVGPDTDPDNWGDPAAETVDVPNAPHALVTIEACDADGRTERLAKLDELMQDCAQAIYDDSELFGSNPSEAAHVLRYVAELVGIEGPTPRLDRLYDDSDLDTGD